MEDRDPEKTISIPHLAETPGHKAWEDGGTRTLSSQQTSDHWEESPRTQAWDFEAMGKSLAAGYKESFCQ